MGEALSRYFASLVFFFCLISFVIGMLAMWLIPKIWHWIIPIIHRLTA